MSKANRTYFFSSGIIIEIYDIALINETNCKFIHSHYVLTVLPKVSFKMHCKELLPTDTILTRINSQQVNCSESKFTSCTAHE